MRCSRNRRAQLATKPRLHPTCSETSSQVWPSVSNKINRALRIFRPLRSTRCSPRQLHTLRVRQREGACPPLIVVYKWLLQSSSPAAELAASSGGSTDRLGAQFPARSTRGRFSRLGQKVVGSDSGCGLSASSSCSRGFHLPQKTGSV